MFHPSELWGASAWAHFSVLLTALLIILLVLFVFLFPQSANGL